MEACLMKRPTRFRIQRRERLTAIIFFLLTPRKTRMRWSIQVPIRFLRILKRRLLSSIKQMQSLPEQSWADSTRTTIKLSTTILWEPLILLLELTRICRSALAGQFMRSEDISCKMQTRPLGTTRLLSRFQNLAEPAPRMEPLELITPKL